MKRLTPVRALVATAATIGLVALPPVVSPASAATGDVLTFGANTFGQLGTGVAVGSTPRPSPTKVANITGQASDVAGGREHVLALVGGTVYAWGADGKGAVGDGGPYSAAITKPKPLGLSGISSIATGHYHSMALSKSSNTVWAWGWNSRGQIGPAGGTAGKVGTPKKVTLPAGTVSMIAAGRAHSLALVNDQVYAWGDNNSGQLGSSPNTTRNPTPTKVGGFPAGTSFKWIAGGRDSSFAITTGGDLYAWGNNQYGQLGNGTTTSTYKPQKVLSGASQVESGADHTLALKAGVVYTWGRNEYGQLGHTGATQKAPKALTTLPVITEVRVGRDHSMAIDANHHLWTWGRNDGGQLGAASPSERPTPAEVTDAGSVKDAGGGQVYTVVVQGS